ncbi:MAG: hypothetical protein GY841_01975 [FCB group bacterium]|nr:hypothetical protein [FCB group bacterium]
MIINESGIDSDTRIEGDTDANLFFIDASTDRVGIGVIDPYTKLEVNGVITATGGDSDEWNTAYGWGDHSVQGYLTSGTETDPVFTAWDKSTGITIIESQISDLDHFTTADETDQVWTAASPNYYTKTNMQTSGQSQLHWDNLTAVPAGFADGVDDTGVDGLWTAGTGDDIYRENGNVGIGTTTPDSLLEVSGTGQPQIRLTRTDGANPGSLTITKGTDVDEVGATIQSIGDILVDSSALTVGTSNNGVLNVDGIATFSGGDQEASITGNIYVADTKEMWIEKVRARDADGLALFDDGGNGIFVQDGGSVGIGTTTPTPGAALDVNGTIRMVNIATSGATMHGTYANTHVNTGFGSSVTGTSGQNYSYSTVSGGYNNTANGEGSTVSGGANNSSDYYSTVGGGSNNTASDEGSTVSGGKNNTVISGNCATISGGEDNTVNSEDWNTIGGGNNNAASGEAATISGGVNNIVSQTYSTVGGGINNTASGEASTVSGGRNNTAAGSYSWAGGKYMQLTSAANNTFVWGHAETAQSIATANAFLIFPSGTSGRAGIGITNPTHLLHVNGIARSTQSTWATSSDRRVKTDIRPLSGSLDKIERLNPVTFEYVPAYIGDNEALTGRKTGFIAQEVVEIDPTMVSTVTETFGDRTIKDFQTLNTGNMIPMLVDALKEQQVQLESLKAENDELKARIEALERK